MERQLHQPEREKEVPVEKELYDSLSGDGFQFKGAKYDNFFRRFFPKKGITLGSKNLVVDVSSIYR